MDGLGSYVTLCDFFETEHESYDTSSNSAQTAAEIERIDANSINYHDFFHRYMEPNIPVILQNLAKDWNATKKWVKRSSNEDETTVPHMTILKQHFGKQIAPVHVQSKGGFPITRPKTNELTVSEYTQWWHNHKFLQSLSNDEKRELQIDTTDDHQNQLYYLKDWKFRSEHPKYKLYICPAYFQDDWLNHVMAHKYQFVYLGPKGTSTRLHADVLYSYSSSTNICGVKRWYLIPPQYIFY